MEDSKNIQLKSKDNQVIQCNAKLLQFSSVLQNNPETSEEIPCKLHDAELLKKIIEFYELFNFDENEFKTDEFNKKITSDKLKENLSQKCLDFLKPWIKDENKVDIEKMKEITEACYHYDLKELKTCLLKAIGTDFYCGSSDTEIDSYKKKFNLPNEIPPEEQLRIMTVEFKDVFDKLNQKLQEELKKAEPSLAEGEEK